MARLKFLLFAVLVLGLGFAHLAVLSPSLTERAIELASAQAQAAPAGLSGRMMEMRLEAQRTALKAASSTRVSGALAALKAKEPLTPEKFTAVRSALMPGVPDSVRPQLVLGIINDSGSLFSRGEEDPKADFVGLDLQLAAQAGSDGLLQQVGDIPYVLYSFPSRQSGAVQPASDAKPPATLVVGAPLLPEEAVNDAMRAASVSALALLQSGKVKIAGGMEKGAIERYLKELQPGKTAVLARGAAGELGPLALPLFTQPGRAPGRQAPQSVGFRQAVEGTPFEVVSVVSLKPFASALAQYQRMALLGLMGLVVLTALWTWLIGESRSAQERAELEERRVPRSPPMRAGEMAMREDRDEDRYAPIPTAMPPSPPADMNPPAFEPESAPLPPERNLYEQRPSDDAYFSSSPPSFVQSPDSENGSLPPPPEDSYQFDGEQTRAYSIQPNDPLLMAPDESAQEDNGDATRVAMIPDELLRASARPVSELPFDAKTVTAPPSVGQAQEEQYFQELYQEFLSTREKCRETGPGMTYEKFATKLQKSKEQLTQKYNCKFVRFHVYVKEGKAALKATPVKD